MTRDTNKRRAVLLSVAIVGVLALAMATAAFAATPKHHRGAVGGGKGAAISSFSPTSVAAGSVTFGLTANLGATHADPATWTATWSGPTTGGTALTVESSTTTSVTLTIPASLVTTAGYATVTVSDGTTTWVGTNYQILAPTPTLTSIAPTSTAAGSAAFTLTATGTNFVGGATVMWDGVALTSSFVTSSTVTAQVPAANVTSVGTHAIIVRNGGSGTPVTGPQTFTVTTPTGPALVSITPATGSNGSTSVPFTLSGTNMDLAGLLSTVTLRGAWPGGSSVTVTGSVATRSATSITGTFNLASPTALVGTYDVILTGNSLTATLPSAYTVTGPTLTAIVPNFGVNSNATQSFALTGTGLNGLTGPTVTLKRGTTTVVTATGLTAAPTGLSMTGAFNLASPLVAAGVYDVVLTYSGTATVKLTDAFTVNNPVPTITSISPTTAYAGSTNPSMVLTVNGTGFVPAPTPAIPGGHGSLIRIGATEILNTTFVSSTQLTTPLLPSYITSAGTLAISVVSPTPGGGASLPVNLTVAADTAAPVTTITGADDDWHNTDVVLTVTATDSQSGVQRTQYIINALAPVTLVGTTITVPADGDFEGENVVEAWSTDWCGNVEDPGDVVTVKIDTVRPKAFGKAAKGTHGKNITLKYKLTDALSPEATAVYVKIKNSKGKVVKTQYFSGDKDMGTWYSFKWKAGAKGTYKYYVHGEDLAGNPSTTTAAKITVK